MRRIDEIRMMQKVDKLRMRAERMIKEKNLSENDARFYFREALKDVIDSTTHNHK
jgi:hypothetical protein